jgi:NitT/TauT family transport system substrate-binding protein
MSKMPRSKVLVAAPALLLAAVIACAPTPPPAPPTAPAKPIAAGPTSAPVPAVQPTQAAAKPAAAKDKLKLPVVSGYELTLGMLVAHAKDYFGEQNIEIEDFVIGSGGTLRQAVIAKEFDFVMLAFVHVPIARQANSPWKMVLSTYDRETFSLLVRSELKDQVKSVADLRGKKVGFSTPGSAAWAYGSAYLKKAGLNPETDVEFVSLGADPSVIFTALQTGKVDAFPTWEPTTTRLLSGNLAYPLISIWKPEDHREWVGGDRTLGYGLVTREDVIQAKPDLVKRMVNAIKKGLDFIRANPIDTVVDVLFGDAKASEQFIGSDRQVAIDIINKLKPGYGTGCLSKQGFQVEMDLSVKYELVKAPLTFEEFADPTWAGVCES